ncbi:hypothetical protein [Variovorax paradoxus]|uniref:hypothetical protein n=1 Tax=Variovorax paradoxus TaxID=34073 RepID=UPI00277E75C3|nr:hypothetical protein [Variovorax paradoxus]MDP9929426.1 hypothetical protein [Variovorax paradoxus]
MSSDDNKTAQSAGDDGALRDPMLRRALDHAPDHDALPDPRTRDAIRKMAHNLATVPATPPAAAAPWWRRLFGGGGETHARMPWNAAFATVLVATFVTVLWHREPVPDARLDGEARVASAPPAASVSAPAAVPPAPAPAPAPAQPPTEAARDAVSGGAPQRREDPVRRTAPAPVPSDKPTAPAPVIAAAPPPPSAPAVVQPSPAPMAEQSAPAPRAFPRTEERHEESEPENRQRRSRDAAGAPPAAAMAPAAPPSPRESADSSASPALSAAQRSANSSTEASGALRQAPAARAPAPASAAAKAKASADDASAFSALDQWTSLNLTRAGQGSRQARGDTEGLAALVNAVARSATAPGAELAAPVEARLELYRGATLLAVLEISGDQVRWTPQAGTGGGASVGTPPASTLAALRALLVRQ